MNLWSDIWNWTKRMIPHVFLYWSLFFFMYFSWISYFVSLYFSVYSNLFFIKIMNKYAHLKVRWVFFWTYSLLCLCLLKDLFSRKLSWDTIFTACKMFSFLVVDFWFFGLLLKLMNILSIGRMLNVFTIIYWNSWCLK